MKLKIFGAVIALLSAPGVASANGLLVLSDNQLDTVTAGIAMNLDLAATATGPTAATATNGAVHVGTADVLTVGGSAKSGWHLTGDRPSQVAFGGGVAAASGAAAGCTAKIQVVGDLAYLNQISAATATPIGAICTCAALAISFIPR